MLKRLPTRAKRGVSLIELMISLGIFGTTMVGALSLANTEWNVIQKNKERVSANRMLEARLEEMRDLTYDELAAQPAQTTYTGKPSKGLLGTVLGVVSKAVNTAGITNTEASLRDSKGKVTIVEIQPDLKQVTIEVTWKPGMGKKEITMSRTTYITRNGVGRK